MLLHGGLVVALRVAVEIVGTGAGSVPDLSESQRYPSRPPLNVTVYEVGLPAGYSVRPGVPA